ncbi:MAG: S41 family peptidase, partial [Planctomycetota bacterium]
TDDGVESFPVTLTRSKIDVKSIKGWRHLPGGGWEYFIDPDQKIAYVRITQFSEKTTRDLKAALRELENEEARGMILDLRYNPGGLLGSAVEVADMFLDGGRIVSTKSERDHREQAVLDARRESSDIELPMAVLVNEMSASASEIVSGALRDLDRATVIGMRTFGKGSVQMLFPVGRGAARLKLTTSHYHLPNGESIHKDEMDREWGVNPDLQIEMTNSQLIAAQTARNDLDVLQREGEPLAGEPIEELQQTLLDSDPQLSAALLVLRLQLAADEAAVALRE